MHDACANSDTQPIHVHVAGRDKCLEIAQTFFCFLWCRLVSLFEGDAEKAPNILTTPSPRPPPPPPPRPDVFDLPLPVPHRRGQAALSAAFSVLYGITLGCMTCASAFQSNWTFGGCKLFSSSCPESACLLEDAWRYCTFADPGQVKKTRNLKPAGVDIEEAGHMFEA